jgi:hypothetical protein
VVVPHRLSRPLLPPRAAAAGVACSFCGKPRGPGLRLVAGPSVYSYAECVGLCNEILAQDEAGVGGPAGESRTWSRHRLVPPSSATARASMSSIRSPFGAPVVAQVVEEADDGDDVGPRVVGVTGRALPQGGEPLGGIGAEGQQVHPAVRDVGHGRAGAGGLPVHHPGHRAAPPQHVAGVEVAVHQHRRQAGRWVVADLCGPLPRARVPVLQVRPSIGARDATGVAAVRKTATISSSDAGRSKRMPQCSAATPSSANDYRDAVFAAVRPVLADLGRHAAVR